MGERTGPKRGEAVFSWARKAAGLQGNGKILWVDWEEREVMVEFYDEPPPENYSFEDMCWAADFSGIWYID